MIAQKNRHLVVLGTYIALSSTIDVCYSRRYHNNLPAHKLLRQERRKAYATKYPAPATSEPNALLSGNYLEGYKQLGKRRKRFDVSDKGIQK